MWERFKLPEGWLTFLLLFVMLISAAMSMLAAGWTKGLGHLTTAATLALLAGLLLARSRFPAVVAHLFSLAYGLFTVGYLIGGMVNEPTWPARVAELGKRLVTWANKAASGGTSRDSLMFVLMMTGLFWLLGHIAAWYTFRRPRLWRVLLPIGVTLLVNYYVYTDPRISTRSTASLVPFVVVFLLTYLRELEWQSSQVEYSTEVRFDFVRSGLILAAVALLVMIIAPGARAGPNISTLWGGVEEMRNDVRDTATRLFSSLDTYGRGVANPFTGRLLLGGPRNLGDEVLFDVRASGGRYWRANVYDRYTGDTWISSDDQKVQLNPGQPASSSPGLMRNEITQTVTIYLQNSTQLLAAPEPMRVPALFTRVNVSFEQDRMTPASALHSQKALSPGNTYQIVSSVSRADPDSLRAASQDYPDWITKRYLQLPGTLTDRTRDLAQEITAGHEPVFEKAEAIEQYLRNNLRYDLDVPAPPEDQDFVDFVLFDLQAGYCDYYASSFVALARSAGIPTRFAVGYAQGQYDREAKAYRVRAKNGHSWPEVFFPEYGWVQFEPTVIIDPIDWPAPPADSSDAANETDPGGRDPGDPFDPFEDLLLEDDFAGAGLNLPRPNRSLNVSTTFLILAGLLVAAALGTGFTYWKTEVRGMGGLSLIERAYARMWRLAERLGVPSPLDQTPYERAEALTMLVPEAESSITRIADLYVIERFGRGNGSGDGNGADTQWSILRPKLWKTWLMKKLSRFQQKDRRRRWQDFYETHQTGAKRPTEK
jgi:hypothetical protein